MLTRQQIEAMTSEEVNDYLARQVLGWELESGLRPIDAFWACRDDSHTGCMRVHWHPSTRIDDVMWIVKRVGLEQDGQPFMLAFNMHSEMWEAGWFDFGWEELSRNYHGAAKDVARAICNAIISTNELVTSQHGMSLGMLNAPRGAMAGAERKDEKRTGKPE